MKLSAVIEELIEERDIDHATLAAIVCEGILAAYKKKYPDLELKAQYDKRNDLVQVVVGKTVASVVEDDLSQLSLRKARVINPDAQLGEVVWVPFEGGIGRVEILAAKQVIAERIRKIEAANVHAQFAGQEGSVVHGTVYKPGTAGVTIKVGETFAFLPKSLSIPEDKYIVGAPIRAILREVLTEPKNDNQLILDRASSDFLQRLLELEIPEIFERVVEVKKIARIPGYKSKIVVASSDPNVDPVGTCVGVAGARIKPILRELAGEKIDVIAWTPSLEDLIAGALKPAQVERVELIGSGAARVWLDEDQRSLAIGKMGQNILLASRLTGVDIQLAQRGGPESLSSLGSQEA